MGRRSVARVWLIVGTLWALGVLPFRSIAAQEIAPVEFELAPKTLVRFGQPAWSLAVSPDGKWSAVGQEDGQILIRDTIDHKILHVLKGHDGAVSALAFHPSSEQFASAGQDGKVHLWNVSSGQLQHSFAGHGNWLTCLAFSPDGQTLASAGYDKTLRLWNTKTFEPARMLDLPATVRTLVFSPNGQTLAFAGDDGAIRFLDLDSGSQETPLPEQPGGLCAVAYSPIGKTFLTVPNEGKIQTWNLETNQPDKELGGEGGNSISAVVANFAEPPRNADITPQSAQFSPDGLSVLVATRGGQVRIWSPATGQLLQTLSGHEDVITTLAMSAQSKTLYSVGLDGKFLAWPAQLPLESPLYKLPMPSGEVWALVLSPNGQSLAVGGKDGMVELWDLSTLERQRRFEGFDGTVDCLDFSADGKLLAAAGWREETAVLWNVETGEVARKITGVDKMYSIALSPDAGQLAAGYKSNQGPDVFSLADGMFQQKLAGHDLSVYAVAFSPDGTKIASTSGEWTERKPGRVMIHDAVDGAKLAQFDNHTHAVRSLVFTPDGSKLCSLSQDGILQIYEVQGLRESITLKNGLDSRPLASSPDGSRIAVGLQNGNINLWNLERREIERRLKGTDDLFSLEFSKDGSLLFAADGNDFVQIWQLSEGENTLARTMKTWLNRPAIAESPAKTPPQETP
jgi:WD40 repeat protein